MTFTKSKSHDNVLVSSILTFSVWIIFPWGVVNGFMIDFKTNYFDAWHTPFVGREREMCLGPNNKIECWLVVVGFITWWLFFAGYLKYC